MFDSAKLKVGDKVIIVASSGYESLTKIIKITPTGRIRVEKNPTMQFDRHGCEMGSNSWNRWYLVEVTDERIKQIEMKGTIRKAFELMDKCEKLSYTQAVKIIDILGGDNNE